MFSFIFKGPFTLAIHSYLQITGDMWSCEFVVEVNTLAYI